MNEENSSPLERRYGVQQVTLTHGDMILTGVQFACYPVDEPPLIEVPRAWVDQMIRADMAEQERDAAHAKLEALFTVIQRDVHAPLANLDPVELAQIITGNDSRAEEVLRGRDERVWNEGHSVGDLDGYFGRGQTPNPYRRIEGSKTDAD